MTHTRTASGRFFANPATLTPPPPARAAPSNAGAAPATADEVTQAGLQAAQQSLNDDRSEVDYDKVAQMQAALSAGTLRVDPDQLAGDMLNFFRQ